MLIRMLRPVHPPHETYESTWGRWSVGGAPVEVTDEVGQAMIQDFGDVFVSVAGVVLPAADKGVPMADRAFRGGKRRA